MTSPIGIASHSGPRPEGSLHARAEASGPLEGRVRIPGDKSVSHRALLVGALAAGTSEVAGLLESEDVLATMRALDSLGIRFRPLDGGRWAIDGAGTFGFSPPDDVLDCGNSGTSARLLLGALAGHAFPAVLTGDASLRGRPMQRIIAPLSAMGAEFVAPDPPTLPLTIRGRNDLLPADWDSPVASAQVKTSILFAGLHARGETRIREPRPSRDHGERMLRRFGATIRSRPLEDGRLEVSVLGGDELRPARVEVPGDISSAAFPLVAALLTPGSEVRLEGVGVNPLRTGILDALVAMGADLRIEDRSEASGEPVADLVVRSRGRLKGVDLAAELVPRTVDEYPVLAVAAAFADGNSRFRGVAELRVKESDRLEAIRKGLQQVGVTARIDGDDLLVAGSRRPRGGGCVDASLDHRIAMAFLVLGSASQEPVEVRGADAIRTSWPGFPAAMRSLGARVTMTVAEP